MWTCEAEPVDDGLRLRFSIDRKALTFANYLDLLETSRDFASWYSESLAGAGPDAFFWEHPPLTRAGLDGAAECVLIKSGALASLEADPQPFSGQFASHPRGDVITFSNLGGDATLVVPRPAAPPRCYPHLAAFLRHGPRSQVESLWRQAARAVRGGLGQAPLWLSTSGLGVAWLHLRLDSRPKYYQHAAYKTIAAARH